MIYTLGMSATIIDQIGQALWFAIFITPLISFPIVWRFSNSGKFQKTLMSLALAIVLAALFFTISMAILLRNGLELS